MTLNSLYALLQIRCHHKNLNKDRTILSVAEMNDNNCTWQFLETRVGLYAEICDGIFSGYSLETLEKASVVTWRYAIPCWLVTDCKMSDLE